MAPQADSPSEQEIIDLDLVPIDLEIPPRISAPPVVTKIQTLRFNDLSWENFERLCVRLVRLHGDIEHCSLYGTRGQRQHGIDLYARVKSSDKFHAYQCKRYEEFTVDDLKSAVAKFKKGTWFKRCSHFVLCISTSLASTQLSDEYERKHSELLAEGIEFTIWDSEEISLQLKTQPPIVDDFFGRAWVEAFCGPDSLTDKSRLDGIAVTEFRRSMRSFYSALTEQLDPGIPLSPTHSRPAIPLGERYVLPDVQVETDVPHSVTKREDGSGRTDASDRGINGAAQQSEAIPQSGEQQSASTGRKYTQRLLLDAWMAQARNHIIIGGPGSGKSTLLRYISLEVLSDCPSDIRVAPWAKLLPVWVPFGFWTKQISDDKPCSVTECVKRWLSLWNQDSLWPIVEAAMKDSRLLILVDGLDEWITIESGRIAADMLQVFLRTQGATAIATTRPFGGINLYGADWHVAELAPLTREQQRELCSKWFALRSQDADTSSSIVKAAIEQQVRTFSDELMRSRDLQELAQVPLLLVSLISVHFRRGVLPTDRFMAYEQLVNYLIQEHPARRRVATLNAGGSGYAPLRERDVRLVFAFIAFSIHPITVVSEESVLEYVEGFLNRSDGLGLDLSKLQARAIAEQFSRVAEGGSGLIIKQGFNDRSFLHRSLQEFLASSYISKLPLTRQIEFVRQHLFDSTYREVILGILWNTNRPDDIENLLGPILDQPQAASREMYRVELLAEVAFGPFNYPGVKAKELAPLIFDRIQRCEWLPHRERLLARALEGLTSARTRDLVRRKLERWTYSRVGWRASWVQALRVWPNNQTTINLLFDLLNDHSFDVQKAAAQVLVHMGTSEITSNLGSEFATTTDPFRQAAILHGFNLEGASCDLSRLILFARNSACPELRIEGIRGRLLGSVVDQDDLYELLNMGSGRRRFRLSSAVADLLIRGWSHLRELKDACFDGLNRFGPRNGLDHEIALRVLLSAFPGDPDVAAYAAKQLENDDHPFLWLHHDAFELLAKNFKDNSVLVAAIDKWSLAQQYRDPEVSYAALVGRTEAMKQILFQHLQSSLPFWAARALITGWGIDDQDVHEHLLQIANGPARQASAIADYIPQIITDSDQTRQRLLELLTDPETRWHSKVVDTLSQLDLSHSQRMEIVQIAIDLRCKTHYIDLHSLDSAIINGFRDLNAVREFAINSLENEEPPVEAVAKAYGADEDVRTKIATLISPLPLPLRSEIVSHLAKGDEDQFALTLLRQYGRDESAEVMTAASIAYHRRLLADGLDMTSALAALSKMVASYGPYMDMRRQAAFAGLVTLRRLDIMLPQRETIAGPLGIRLADVTEINLPLARIIAENWTYVKQALGDELQTTLNRRESQFGLWDVLATVAGDIPLLHSEILDHFDQDEKLSHSQEALDFLAKVKPRSELLRSRCIATIRDVDFQSSKFADLRRAIEILAEQFHDDERVAAEIANELPPFSSIVFALAAIKPNHPYVQDAYRAITARQNVTVPVFFATVYALAEAENLTKLLRSHLDDTELVEFDHDILSDALVRRIKQDAYVQDILASHARDGADKELQMNIFALLNRAGFLTSHVEQLCLHEADSQVRNAMAECGFNVVAGAVRSIPLSLLDIISASVLSARGD